MIQIVTVNLLAVVVAAIAGMVIGALWYSPLLFGKLWMKLSHMTEKDIAQAKKRGMAKAYILQFVATLVTAYVLAHILAYAETASISDGLQGAAWVWLGFFATTALGSVLWEGKSSKLYLLNIAHSLVILLVMGTILAVWI